MVRLACVFRYVFITTENSQADKLLRAVISRVYTSMYVTHGQGRVLS